MVAHAPTPSVVSVASAPRLGLEQSVRKAWTETVCEKGQDWNRSAPGLDWNSLVCPRLGLKQSAWTETVCEKGLDWNIRVCPRLGLEQSVRKVRSLDWNSLVCPRLGLKQSVRKAWTGTVCEKGLDWNRSAPGLD
ncbi:hypothetical protein DPMN_141485 [Dreissena polymorpha]|uniref:Uncharacterized protein n=1 Tax=Dreissena polymorpha TaxID=45954 RepID=A0A9D4JMM7_DREPO|nr:hypothetical protein DPMN_141485 [Dreissena polymorpha]